MANLRIEMNKLLGPSGSDFKAVYDIIINLYESGKLVSFDKDANPMFAVFFRLSRGVKQHRLQRLGKTIYGEHIKISRFQHMLKSLQCSK